MIPGIDPKVDYVFKQICGDEDRALVLVDVVNAVVGFPETRRTHGVTIKNPFVAQEYAEGKVPVLDVRASDDLGRLRGPVAFFQIGVLLDRRMARGGSDAAGACGPIL